MSVTGDPVVSVLLLALVAAATLGVGSYGLRVSRTTSDFYVASRSVGRGTNASAISGEYLSAASFLGVAGLMLVRGADSLWYPIGWTAGFLLLLVFVAAPLRRSGAYTLPDFAELRLESATCRTVASALVCLIGALYLVPQFQGAGITLRTLTGAPRWLGVLVVAAIVLLNVLAGGMRSITLVQAFQYWLKLVALLTPVLALWLATVGGGVDRAPLRASEWVEPLRGEHSLYLTYSLILATFLGTMGLPHVVVRFYTNRDGRAARRTTVTVLGLLGAFYVVTVLAGVLGRLYAADLAATGDADSVLLVLPGRVLDGAGSVLLTALVGAGAFAAFLSTSSGLVVSIGGVISQDLLAGRLGRRLEGRLAGVGAFRLGSGIAAAGALLLTVLATGLPVARAVELAFAVAASTFCPLLLLGIWWTGLTARGAVAGMVVGGATSSAAVLSVLAGLEPPGWLGTVAAQPALVTVPLAFAAMTGVSVLTRADVPPSTARTMVRLHAPEALVLDRGPFRPPGSSDG